MALLSSWGNDNLVIEQGKTITYSCSMIQGHWVYKQSLNQEINYYQAYEIRRNCAMSFSYVGMDYNTAVSCCSAMVQKYTRDYTYSDWDPDTGTFSDLSAGSIPMADCAVIKTAGCMYSVNVSVHEDDSKLRLAPQTASTMFPTENSRSYEDD